MIQLTQSCLQELFIYDSDAGLLIWRHRPEEMFLSRRIQRSWNAKFAGKVAGCLKFTGYRHISLSGKYYQAHRLIWLMIYGDWPAEQIDHIDGNPSNNRIANLRDVSSSENCKNMPRPRDNTSGCVGVGWQKESRKWHAYITVNRKMHSLGFYSNKDDAIATRKSAERALGFHENHGRAA